MELLFVKDGVHLGSMSIDGDNVVIKKFKSEFNPKIVDAPEEDDKDDLGVEPEDLERDTDPENEIKDMFAMRKHEKSESPKEEIDEDDEDDEYGEDEGEVKKFKSKKPMRQKRPGMF